jgi:hypothetical protein
LGMREAVMVLRVLVSEVSTSHDDSGVVMMHVVSSLTISWRQELVGCEPKFYLFQSIRISLLNYRSLLTGGKILTSPSK